MAEAAGSDEIKDQFNSSCRSSKKRPSVDEIENKSSKKGKHDTMKDFKLVKVLAENTRNKTLILHLQGTVYIYTPRRSSKNYERNISSSNVL